MPHKSLITIYKAFLRPLIDYGDIIYDQPQYESFCEKPESIEDKAALAIMGAKRRSYREKMYQELRLESLKSRRWYRRLSCMFKIMEEKAPNYLKNSIPISQFINARTNRVPTFHFKTDCFKYFFPSTLNDCFKLDFTIRNSESIAIFKRRLLSFLCPVPSNVYNVFDPIGLKLLTHLRLGFSHLNEHRFQHNSQGCMNPLCSCSLEIENTLHYLLQCHYFSQNRLMNSLRSVSENFNPFSDNVKKSTFVDPRLDENKNKFIIVATLSYFKSAKRFSRSIFD